MIDNKPFKWVRLFKYLGGTLNCKRTLDNKIDVRISKATSDFEEPFHCLWNKHDVSLKNKISVYKSCISNTLLYEVKICIPNYCHTKKNGTFHMHYLGNICSKK